MFDRFYGLDEHFLYVFPSNMAVRYLEMDFQNSQAFLDGCEKSEQLKPDRSHKPVTQSLWIIGRGYLALRENVKLVVEFFDFSGIGWNEICHHVC